jgi:cystathionine beta-lyase/cystathionine gamma-synthase
MKTLHLRVKQQEKNALEIAKFLEHHPLVTKVNYPGLKTHSGYNILKEQAKGFGAMVSFEVADAQLVPPVLERVRVFLFAESLGGVESLITFPAVQTHADIEPEVRKRLGVTDRLLRISVGVECAEDLINDLAQALQGGTDG